MGVQVERDRTLVTIRCAGRIEDRDALLWADHVRNAARAVGGQVALLIVFDEGIEISTSVLAAAVRQTFGVLHLLRATALVGGSAIERSMLRAATLAVKPSNTVAMFEDDASARAWLDESEPSPPERVPPVGAR